MRAAKLLIAGLVVLAGSPALRAQEMEPRAYSPSPLGTNFIAVIAGKTHGGILFDPAIPITDVKADLNLATIGYGRTFGLGGRQGLVVVVLPYAWGHVEGLVREQTRRVRRAGLADPRVKVSVNLLGPAAMSPEEFRKAPRQTILGVSLTMQAPTGEYDSTKLINLGTNRFAFKPEVGVSVPVGHWYLDAYAGAWFFETNEHFFPRDSTRRQDPLLVVQGHASYSFQSRAWLALDATWFGGGESTLDAGPPSTRHSSTRVGATFSIPLAGRQSLKVAASTGAAVRTGDDFDTYLVAWQLAWFDRPRAAGP